MLGYIKEKMQTEEFVNIEYAKYLSSISLTEFKELYTSKDKDLKSTHSLLVKTCKQILTVNPYKRNFNFSKGKDYGRRFSENGGLQGLPKIIRGALCKDCTTDIDMRNAHPQILLKVLTENEYSCPYLKEYCNNRDFVFKQLFQDDGFSKEDSKNALLRSMNKGTRCISKTDPKINQFFKNFDKEMKDIQNFLWSLEKYNFIKSDVDTSKGNTRGSFLNLILCKCENEILELTVNYLIDMGYEINTLCFDGLLIKGSHYDNTDIIEKLDNLTKNWDIRWSYKPHDKTISIPNDFIFGAKEEDLTEKEYADIFCETYKLQIIRGLNNLYYINEYGIYIIVKNPKEFFRYKLLNEYNHYKFLQKDKNISSVCNIINTLFYDEELDDKMDQNVNLLGFLNGVFDLKEYKFRNALPCEYVSKVINYNFEPSDFSDLENLLRTLFTPETQEYNLWKMGNILRGSNTKTFTAMIGNGNNGKTKVMSECIKTSFGGTFNPLPIPLVSTDKFNVSNSTANPEFLKLKDSNINIVSELPANVVLSCAKFKSFSGGGVQQARKLHSNDVVNFIVKGQIWIDTNSMGEFDNVDQALVNRMDIMDFPYTFKENPDPNNIYEKQLVPDVLNGIKDYHLKFMNLMLYYYNQARPEIPQSILDIKKKVLHSVDDVAKFISTCNTGCKYRCEARELFNTFKQDGGSGDQKQFKNRIESLGFEYKKIRIEGRIVWGYIGIKYDNEDPEDPE